MDRVAQEDVPTICHRQAKAGHPQGKSWWWPP